jgi:hypothetical protein
MIESLEGQLRELYREREHLHDRFGASSPEDIAVMIESLESQLRDFYNRFGSNPGFDDAEIAMTLGKIKELSSTLDPMYAKKSVHFFVENDKPVLRAEWTDITTEGDPS